MNRVTHFEFPTDNPEKSCDFYRMVFGWTFQKYGNTDYWLAKTGPESEPGINGAIMKKKDPDQPVTTVIEVADIDRSIEKITQNNGTIVVDKTTLPGIGYFAYFKDLDDNIVGIMQNDKTA